MAAPEPTPPIAIADHALISDCHGSALVARDGTINWACFGRFDSPSVFARILDDRAGHWRLAPSAPATVERSYVPDSMVLRTRFRTGSGEVSVTDAMVFGRGETGHRIGRNSPHVIVRRVEGIAGSVEMDLEVCPRPEYSLTEPVVQVEPGGGRSRGGPRVYILSSETPIDVRGSAWTARFSVAAGETHSFALAAHSPWATSDAEPRSASAMCSLLDDTIEGWQSWSAMHQSYDGAYPDLVRHSGRVLQALTYAPTGAVVAAATTSLPETIGGARNWDYRFCWVRDASLTMEALWVAACPDEAGEFFGFLTTAAGARVRSGSDLQILYGIGGERLVPEHELTHLAGYRNSRPVRVGNGAWDQVQLDVFGELLSAAWLLAEQVGTFDDSTAAFLVDVANAAAQRWPEPDQGIWEVRGEPRHFVHSKLMCWVALDRAIKLAPQIGGDDHVDGWMETRDAIRRSIEEQGWSDSASAYTQSFGADALDASCLLLLTTGFAAPDDPRIRSTVEAIAARLTDGHGLVYRYLAPDGLDGDEGTFVICSFWLAECWARLGEIDKARALFDTAASFANDVGLLAEEIDAETGELLGNFPQAFTHIGLVNAAWAITQAEAEHDPSPR